MQRMNITVPDALYKRLERVRDRMNASRVCSQALERELDMIETKPAATDPDIQKVIQRLQSTADKWRDRGRHDGRKWAIDQATREDLQEAAENAKWPTHLTKDYALHDWTTADITAAMEQWDREHLAEANGDEATDKRTWSHSQLDRVFAETKVRNQINDSVDKDAYTRGWIQAAQEIWDLV